ncbi:MAG: CPBP family intramembrane metalloprotease [Bacteroidaceae bacterium]|nr:CPBP family intramembrane metalloprotease [Bacteroidaceae bacterium]
MRTFLKPIGAVLIFFLMQLAAGIVLAIVGGTRNVAFTEHAGLLGITLIVSGIATGIILYLLKMIRLKTFSLKNIKWKHAPLGVGAALTGIIAMDLLSEQLRLTDLMKIEFLELGRNPWGIIAIALVAPIVEELVFREAIIGSLLRHRVHRWQAILISAVLFGLVHFNPAQIPFAFVMGLILGVIYVKMGNIVMTSLLHIINNMLAVVEMNVLGDKADSFSYTSALGGTIAVWMYIILSSVLCYVFLTQFWIKYHRKHTH